VHGQRVLLAVGWAAEEKKHVGGGMLVIQLSQVQNCFSFWSEAGFGVHGFGVEKTRGAGRKRKKHAEGGMLVGRRLRSGEAMLQCYLLFPSFSSPHPLCSTSTIRNPWACEHVPDLQQQRSSPEWTVFVGLSRNVSRRKWSQFHNFARRNFESANAETTPRCAANIY
jgi:hypothetical protein